MSCNAIRFANYNKERNELEAGSQWQVTETLKLYDTTEQIESKDT